MTSNHDTLVTLATFSIEMEAQLLVNMLNEHGIAAVASGEFTLQAPWTESPGVVRVLVKQDDLSVARSVLAERRMTNYSSNDNGQNSISQNSGSVEKGESLWSPPQFSLRSLIIAVTALCVACTVIKGFKLDWGNGFAEFAILGMFGWLMVGLYRLVWCSWLAVRPEPKVVIRSAAEYANPEDAFDAAFQLDMQGDWDAAIALYGDVARRWPEHEKYARGCITQVEEKRSRL